MKPLPLPPIGVLDALYTYDPTTGEIRNRYSKGRAQAGDIAGTQQRKYRLCTITHEGKTYRCYAHRIAYALHHGIDPYPMVVDHINRNTSDNRITNLRAISQYDNINNSTKKRKIVRITYPDGRGVIITDSASTAARILNLPQSYIGVIANRKNNQIYYPHPTLPHTRIPTGIRITYE